MKKKQHNGMYGLLAVIALMLAASIYASCSSDDDDYDNGWVELETMARGTRAAGPEDPTPINENECGIWCIAKLMGGGSQNYSIVQGAANTLNITLGQPISYSDMLRLAQKCNINLNNWLSVPCLVGSIPVDTIRIKLFEIADNEGKLSNVILEYNSHYVVAHSVSGSVVSVWDGNINQGSISTNLQISNIRGMLY